MKTILTIAYKEFLKSPQEKEFASYPDAYDYMLGEFDSCNAMSAMLLQLKNGKETKFTITPTGRVKQHEQ